MIAAFDPMRGPPTQMVGNTGIVRIAGLRAGALTSWRIVLSPTTVRRDATGTPILTDDGQPIPAYTLFGEGALLRYFVQAVGASVVAELISGAAPLRIGRPRPRPPVPFRLAGMVYELTARRIVIASGEII